MSKVQEIERAVEQLPPEDFSELVEWIDQRRGKMVRDHRAFLNSYAPEDEGLYDDAVARVGQWSDVVSIPVAG
jgi:hypothetical protein